MLHPIRAYDEDLNFLSDRLAQMGGEAERILEEAVDALLSGDNEKAKAVIRLDQSLDQAQRDIDNRAVLTIARRQPMARDLRIVISIIRMASDIERVGDLAKNIARRVVQIDDDGYSENLFRGIRALADLAMIQISGALDAFVAQDIEQLRVVRERDEEIDAKYTSLFRELLTYMMEDPRNITPCTHLLFCAKSLERVGDHATNIAESVYYMETGQQMPPDRPKDDRSFKIGAE